MNATLVNPNDLLRQHVTDYVPNAFHGFYFQNFRYPLFTQFMVREMLADPRCQFGLSLIKGPLLSKAKIEVVCDNPEVKEFVADQINEFWQNGAMQSLKAIDWGYSGSEVIYKQNEENGRIEYEGLKDFESPSVRIVTQNGNRVGILIDGFLTVTQKPGKAIYLGGPKAFHHVHYRHIHPHYGQSRLYGAHIPWQETWSEGGYRDIRRLWFYKNAFDGGTLYHPMGSVKTESGSVVNLQDYAQEMLEKRRAGATLALPNKTDAKGNREWEFESAKGNTIPQGLFTYGDSLRIEILEAMGIPYEVIENSGSEGFGSSSGREIPQIAFYSILQEELNWLILDLTKQILRPLVQINAHYGKLPYAQFKVISHALSANPEEVEHMEQPQGGNDSKPNPESGKKEKLEKDSEGQNPDDLEENRTKKLVVAS